MTEARHVQAIAEVRQIQPPSHKIVIKLTLDRYGIQYSEGQRLRLTGLSLPLLVRAFATKEGYSIFALQRRIKPGNKNDMKVRQYFDPKTRSVTKTPSHIIHSMLYYPKTTIFNGIDLSSPIVYFFFNSGVSKDGALIHRSKAKGTNNREAVYYFSFKTPGSHEVGYNSAKRSGVDDLFECLGMQLRNNEKSGLSTSRTVQNPVNIYGGGLQFLKLSLALVSDRDEVLTLPGPLVTLALPYSKYATPLRLDRKNAAAIEIPRPLSDIRGNKTIYKELLLTISTLRPETLLYVSPGFVNAGLEFLEAREKRL